MLRFFLTLLGAGRRLPLDLLDASVVGFRVWPTDLDINLHMTNARYLSVMDAGRALGKEGGVPTAGVLEAAGRQPDRPEQPERVRAWREAEQLLREEGR